MCPAGKARAESHEIPNLGPLQAEEAARADRLGHMGPQPGRASSGPRGEGARGAAPVN